MKVNGAYVSPNEHAFYFVLESESVSAISKVLGPPMLTGSEGCVSPVIDLAETADLVDAFEEARKWGQVGYAVTSSNCFETLRW